MNNREDLIKQLKALIASGEKVLDTETAPSHSKPVVNEIEFHEFRISAVSYLSRVFGNNSTHCQSFQTEVIQATSSRTRRGIGILNSAQKELEGDWLETTRGTIIKDVLTGMLRQAKMQLEEENFNAAIIVAGGVVDELLRNLCLARGLKLHNEIQGKAVPKKSLQLTGEAYKKKIYDRQTNKTVVGWIELCSEVVANKNIEKIPTKAGQMISSVQSFLAKTSF